MSSRLRVKTATSSPERCTWMRMPSSFTSTVAGVPVASSAADTSVALCASIGVSGVPTRRLISDSAAAPPVSAATATCLRSPESSSARRTATTGTSAARAIASASSPACAPCRSSPLNSPTSSRCSSAVAAPNSAPTSSRRRACEPAPATTEIAAIAASTAATVRLGSAAGGGRSRRLA